MLISKGDLVRPSKINLGLPLFSVWRVISTVGGLRLYPHNAQAHDAHHLVTGLLYKSSDFKRQTLNAVGEWVDECSVTAADEVKSEDLSSSSPSPKITSANSGAVTAANQANDPDEPRREAKAVAKAREAVKQAADCAARLGDELAKARAAESQRKAELRAAQLEAQRKEELRRAAAQARADAQRRDLHARLDADHCLALATLELIAEVSRLNNGGYEAHAHASIANHADQLQPLARSYGYRIVKPSMAALVVKL